jgi:hypothetical protein
MTVEDYWYLCCSCGSITPYGKWTFWRRPLDEAEETAARQAGTFWLPNDGREDPMCRCPCCGWEHTDTEDGSGMYDGTLEAMIEQRQQLVLEEDSQWLDWWNDRLMERETDWQGARAALHEFEHVAGEPLAETAAVAAQSHAFAFHTAQGRKP